MPPLAARTLFASLFAYCCKRPLIAGRRKTIFGRYASFSIRHAERSPLVLLLKELSITEDVSKIEVLVKEGEDPDIDDTDLEAVIRNVREEPNTLADRVTTEPTPFHGKYESREQWQQEANAARLNHLKDLKGPQLRTLIKKLSFLLSFERAGMEIAEACEHAHISRKTFYLWNAKDPVFKKLLNIRNT